MSRYITITWADGSSYHGEVENGVPNGKGILKIKGLVYEGIWKKGFSYALYKEWLKNLTNNRNITFTQTLKGYKCAIDKITSPDALARQSIEPIDVLMQLKFFERGVAYIQQIKTDIAKIFVEEVKILAQTNEYPAPYSCGGRYPLPNDFDEKIMPIIYSLTIFNDMNDLIMDLERSVLHYDRMASKFKLEKPKSGKSEKQAYDLR